MANAPLLRQNAALVNTPTPQHCMILRPTICMGILLALASGAGQVQADSLSLTLPKARQITQRNPSNAADLGVAGNWSGSAARLEARAVVMAGGTNNGSSTDWVVIANLPTNGAFSGTLPNVAAGGWYRVEVRAVDAAPKVLLTAGVDRVGVGDVFLTAGQSNAGGWGSPRQTTSDDRVSAYIVASKGWQPGKDSQPENTGGVGSGGSPWPILGSLLIASNHVPVGFVGLAVGGSALASWLPGTTSFQNLSNALRTFGTNGLRAVLWHQGETDAASMTPAATYAQRLSNVISQSRSVAGWSVPWGIAEASYGGGSTPAGMEGVRAGQRRCIYSVPNCFRGARTDDFHLEGKLSDTVHFNAAGLADHAQQWADALLGVEEATVKNANFEANLALLDGRIDVASQVIGWNRLNAAGDSATTGNGGYLNPGVTYYPNTADTLNGGVLPNMNGRHLATLSGNPGDAFLQTLRAHLQPSTIYTLQAAVGLRSGNFFGGCRLDLLTNGTPCAPGTAGDIAALNALAGGDATNKFTVVSCVVTSAVAVGPNSQLAIRISKPASGYLDFDDVRLTTQLTAYGQWQMTHWSSLTIPDSLPEADPDRDGLPNWIEFQLADANPRAATAMPRPVPVQVSGEDYWQMQLLKNPAAPGAIEIQLSYDLNSWFAPISSGNGDVVLLNDAGQYTLQLRRSATPKAFFRSAAPF